jgi:hypothetical protein
VLYVVQFTLATNDDYSDAVRSVAACSYAAASRRVHSLLHRGLRLAQTCLCAGVYVSYDASVIADLAGRIFN